MTIVMKWLVMEYLEIHSALQKSFIHDGKLGRGNGGSKFYFRLSHTPIKQIRVNTQISSPKFPVTSN